MSWCKQYENEWKEIIKTVAREQGRTELMVEKDTIQSMFLLELSKSELPFVFKGGTSLSKAYNLIDRFSEDIDLSMNRKPTQSERKQSKKIIMNIADMLEMVLDNPEEIKSRHDYNMYVFKYPSLFAKKPMEIIIETSYYQTVYPVDKHDVCKLLGQVNLDEKLDKLIDDVREDRMKSPNNPSAQLDYNIPKMLNEIIESRFYESDYKNITQKLLYENIDYDYAVKNGIEIVSKSDVFLYKEEK